ncbi:MAG TPA: DNA ligase [Desulfuromonadales bacterium]|nr:DNA ligase [Desulfuromonadales bacterium]
MLSEDQKAILHNSGIYLSSLTEEQVDAIAGRQIDETELTDDQLVEFLEIANALYRGGSQIISDAEYDFTFLTDLRMRNPHHPFLEKVESEAAFIGKTVELPARMLSTEKAYSKKAIEQWGTRIRKAADKVNTNFDSLEFRVTPKLDGFAAYDDGVRLYTRGDGRRGTDITRVFDRGLSVANEGERGLGAGEIVVNRRYFDENLQQYFENPRNFQTSVIKEKELEEYAAKAIQDKASVFFPFTLLPSWVGAWQALISNFEAIVLNVRSSVEYDVDGVIIEITDNDLKNEMGATRHHHSWQIAYKENMEAAHVTVIDVLPQTSRSGRVNPVAKVEPTRLSGALVQRATAHHYKMVLDKGIGPGAVIELTRSGEVIPKIGTVITPVVAELPRECPSCGSEVVWDGDYLYCPNTIGCPAQIANTMEHFFKMLRHVDLFGTASIEKMYANGVRSVEQIYKLEASDFENMGFGPKQSENLVEQLNRSRAEKIEDWRFLAAFGVFRLGPGNCEKLLSHYLLEDIFNLNEDQIVGVEGFAKKTAIIAIKGLKSIKPLFDELYSLGFNLERTPLVEQIDKPFSPISGKQIVFTGSMIHGNRDDMEKEAKRLGAKVGKSVTGKTDILVTGANVGASKMNDAKVQGVQILSEKDYLELIK